MQLPMAMMMSCERRPPSMPPSQDKAHTMIGDFTEITVSNSDNDLHLVRVTSARSDGRMPDIPEVEIWRTVSLWMFLLSLLFTSLLLWISAQYKWRRHGFLPPPETSQVEVEFPRAPNPPRGCSWSTDRLWDLLSRAEAYAPVSFLLWGFSCYIDVCGRPGGLLLKGGIM